MKKDLIKIGVVYTDKSGLTYKYRIFSFTRTLYTNIINTLSEEKDLDSDIFLGIKKVYLFLLNLITYDAYKLNMFADIERINGLYINDSYYRVFVMGNKIEMFKLNIFDLNIFANIFFIKNQKNSWEKLNKKTKCEIVKNDNKLFTILIASKYYYSFHIRNYI